MEPKAHTFADLGIGDQAIVRRYVEAPQAYRMRLMSLGLTPGTRFRLLKAAPLGDPLEIEVRGFRLALRRSEAACIEVTRL